MLDRHIGHATQRPVRKQQLFIDITQNRRRRRHAYQREIQAAVHRVPTHENPGTEQPRTVAERRHRALIDRLHAVHFPRKVPEHLRDASLTDKIVATELPGLLNLLLEHLRRVLTQPPAITFKNPEAAYHIIEEIGRNGHPLQAFFEECTDHTEPGTKLDHNLIVHSIDLYHAYQAWKRRLGETHTLGISAFNEQIKADSASHST